MLRNEYCQEVVDEGGLKVIMEIFSERRGEVKLVTRALVLLKVMLLLHFFLLIFCSKYAFFLN